MPSQFLPSGANPAIGNVSRCTQVFFTQSLPAPMHSGCRALSTRRLKADLAGMREHFAAVYLEGFAELRAAFGDNRPELRLPLEQGQLAKVFAVQVQEIEGD